MQDLVQVHRCAWLAIHKLQMDGYMNNWSQGDNFLWIGKYFVVCLIKITPKSAMRDECKKVGSAGWAGWGLTSSLAQQSYTGTGIKQQHGGVKVLYVDFAVLYIVLQISLDGSLVRQGSH